MRTCNTCYFSKFTLTKNEEPCVSCYTGNDNWKPLRGLVKKGVKPGCRCLTTPVNINMCKKCDRYVDLTQSAPLKLKRRKEI